MSTKQPPEPGVYEGVEFEEYLSWPYISNSKLSAAERSMAHFRLGKAIEETEAMRLGTLVHAGKLEPLALMQRYVVMPDIAARLRKPDGSQYEKPRATAAYRAEVKEFEAQHPGKVILEQDDYDTMLGVVTALANHHRARLYLDAPGPIEVAIVWDDPETGIRLKGRLDKLARRDRRIADLKTSFDPAEFATHIARRGYHRQGALYVDGMQVLTGEQYQFCLVAAETKPPFGVRAAPLSDDSIETGRSEYRGLLRQIAECLTSQEWPAYDDPEEWVLPAWKLAKDEPLQLTIGGKAVSL